MQLRIQLVKSPIGYHYKQRNIARALGLTRMQQVVVKPANDSVRGMVNTISHLLKVEEIPGEGDNTTNA